MTIKAEYPGAPVLLAAFRRGDETGDVRVQQFAENKFRVGAFLPGVVVELPGDSIKVEPEVSQWVFSIHEAERIFLRYLDQAGNAGWHRAPEEDNK